jgi:hypothetical protein
MVKVEPALKNVFFISDTLQIVDNVKHNMLTMKQPLPHIFLISLSFCLHNFCLGKCVLTNISVAVGVGTSQASSPVHPKPNQLELFPSTGSAPRSSNGNFH